MHAVKKDLIRSVLHTANKIIICGVQSYVVDVLIYGVRRLENCIYGLGQSSLLEQTFGIELGQSLNFNMISEPGFDPGLGSTVVCWTAHSWATRCLVNFTLPLFIPGREGCVRCPTSVGLSP